MSITATTWISQPSPQPGETARRAAATAVPFSKLAVVPVKSRFGIDIAKSAQIAICTGATAVILSAPGVAGPLVGPHPQHVTHRAAPAQKGGTGR